MITGVVPSAFFHAVGIVGNSVVDTTTAFEEEESVYQDGEEKQEGQREDPISVVERGRIGPVDVAAWFVFPSM